MANYETDCLLGLIALNNRNRKYAAIRRDDLLEIFRWSKNVKASLPETEFSFLIEKLKYDKIITEYYEPEGSANLICAEYQKLVPIIGNYLNDHSFLQNIISVSPYLNHLINSVRVENNYYSYSLNYRKVSCPLKPEATKYLEDKVIDKIIRNFDFLRWSGLRCSEVSGGKPVWYSDEFDQVSKISNLCYYFKTRIDKDIVFRNIILKNFRAIDIEVYAAHFLVANRYQEIHKVLRKYLDIGETDNIAVTHFMKIRNITEYVNYIRAWRNTVKSSLIKLLADQNKKSILDRFSCEIYRINGNPYTLNTNLMLVLKYLNWKNELDTESKFLNNKIHEFAGNRICHECYTRKMVFMEGVIFCNECGFSMEP